MRETGGVVSSARRTSFNVGEGEPSRFLDHMTFLLMHVGCYLQDS